MIIHSKRLIFVHIQKTGGTAVRTALGESPYCPAKHRTARDLRDLYGADVWNAYFKFAFVRNPWDRLVSWWSMIDAHRTGWNRLIKFRRLNKFQRFVLESARTFEEFLENCDLENCDEEIFGSMPTHIYQNQLDYVTDPSGREIVDFIGHFETLQQDFDAIAAKVFGGSILLPQVNKSRHRHYSDYYTPELAAKVGCRFERDIKRFGYSFEKSSGAPANLTKQ